MEKENANTVKINEADFPTLSKIDPVGDIGSQIGPYRLLSVLGEGGFGIVYLAEQKEPVRRQVALKVIKPGMDSKQVINRFEAERQALALLDHPNIARVFDGGISQQGRPYFVMELVKGLSITDYCDQHKLNIEERLELFQHVCDAIQHAHQKGIIHRDIKPSNILVSLQDNKPTPKIIDFGVAKAINQPLTERTLFTQQGQLIGTPEYMSPEQAKLTSEDIDTRSDIYSLGVLLYELLTGSLPFDPKTLREVSFDGILKYIREEEPPKPSTKLLSLGEKATQAAAGRRTTVRTLSKRLHKELEWIPLKAMRKERERRYRTAAELADDIKNYLSGKPLTAGPESVTYLLKKFVKRHQYTSTVVSLLLVIILSFSFTSLYLFVQTRNAKQDVVRIRTELNDLLTGVFKSYGQIGFMQFLEFWHEGKINEAEFIAGFLGTGTKEKKGTSFLLDSRPVLEKEVDFRQELTGELTWFSDFVIGEQYLNSGDFKDALQSYRRSYGHIQRIDRQKQSILDTILTNQVMSRLYSLDNANNEAKNEPEIEGGN